MNLIIIFFNKSFLKNLIAQNCEERFLNQLHPFSNSKCYQELNLSSDVRNISIKCI